MKLSIREMTVFSLFAALMFVSRQLMSVLMNVHILAPIIVAFTFVCRKKALWPIYIYAAIECIYAGFNTWVIPYLYIWTVLWVFAMLLPKTLPKKWEGLIFMSVCALHGLLFGLLYAPFQALAFGLSFKGTLAWIAAGIPGDITHCISNFCAGTLTLPIIKVLNMTLKKDR